MTDENPDKLRPWLPVTVFSLIFVPLAVFFGGLLLAGPYAGDAGFFGLLGGIYTDAITGHFGAILLLLSPVLLLAIWKVAAAAYRLICRQQAATADRSS